MEKALENLVRWTGITIFAIRWLLAPVYLALYVVLVLYIWKYFGLVYDIFQRVNVLSSDGMMLIILQLIDMGMIANLVVMTTIGGYSIFVKEFKGDEFDDRPRWLSADFSSSQQKIKLGMSLMGVALVNLLDYYFKSSSISWDELGKQCLVIIVTGIATVTFCYIERLIHPKKDHEKAHANEHK